MEQWKGKVAIVTGASAGIGYEICKDLCRHGVTVVGVARRLDRLKELRKEIHEENAESQFYPARCDVSQETQIQVIFDYAKQMFGGVDIMLNNAGMAKCTALLDKDNLETLKSVMDTNLMGLVSFTKKAFESMAERDVPGYIINVSSVAGHYVVHVPGMKPEMNLYSPSKYALRALVTVLRHELNYLKQSKIRVTNISPGAVKTEFGVAAGIDFEEVKALQEMPVLESKDVSDAVIYILGTNPRVQIEDFIIRPTGEMF